MTHEEKLKLYNDLKDWLIVKHRYRFLKLSEENQHKMIMHLIQTYADKVKFE